jgi:hypothetical protein
MGEIAELRRYYAEHRTAPEELLNEVTNRPKSSTEQLREQLREKWGMKPRAALPPHELVYRAIKKRHEQAHAIAPNEPYDEFQVADLGTVLVVAGCLFMAATLYFGWFTHN